MAVNANYTLEVLMLSYHNPTHMSLSLENFRQGCCESDNALPCNPCDNAFRVCVKEIHAQIVPFEEIIQQFNLDEEGLLKLETSLIVFDNDDLTFPSGEDVGGLSNPIRVQGDLWPVSH